MVDKITARVAESSPKVKRMSMVALVAAVLAVVWAIIDQFTAGVVAPVIVSSVTSLAMLVAGFYDHKNPPTFDGEVE